MAIAVVALVSCNNEEVYVDPEVSDSNITGSNEDVDSEAIYACDFGLNNVESNSTIIINCLLDLEGETINLPNNISLLGEGGDIINGTLNFSEGTYIDVALMNSSLILAGEKPAIRDVSFNFEPSRWGIVEGKVSDAVALKNREILNSMMVLAKNYGFNTLKIDEMDAYFEVGARVNNPKIKSEEAILIPSDFNLAMTDNTFIRVQPSNAHSYALIMVYESENISITGGNLVGDRWEHDYTPIIDLYGNSYDSHEWGHVMDIRGGVNVVIDGVRISDASGDGFQVAGSTIRNIDGTAGNSVISTGVVLKNSIIEASRRNALSLLDGDGILVENCDILDTALGTNPTGENYSSAGTWPKHGVSFEAWRVRNSDGSLYEYEKIENVILRGNRFKGNIYGDIVLFTGSFITVENNYFESRIGNKASNNIIIRNNVMQAGEIDGEPSEYGILIKSYLVNDEETNFNYEIYGNKIDGYKNAMVLSGENFDVHDNALTGFKSAISLGKRFYYSKFYNNTLETDLSTSYGYVARGADIKDINIKNENITVGRRSVDFYDVIADSEQGLVFDNCEFNTISRNKSNIDGCENITIKNSTFNVDFSVVDDSKNILFIDNNK
ncbi:right-handed parallel beta-helix repeat-containing protein [Algibacter miyuki]|uniref:Right-handed parallel beta-helix repeat-containing protein n=2 Tax=Algibacter miyuki TaxID=1306933 RepID=A0ABV5GYC2_9FLAO|nr:hypothetical protein [Algibacter miyuki]